MMEALSKCQEELAQTVSCADTVHTSVALVNYNINSTPCTKRHKRLHLHKPQPNVDHTDRTLRKPEEKST